MFPRSAQHLASCYDHNHHGVMCSLIANNGVLYELYDGVVSATTHATVPHMLRILSVHCSVDGTLVCLEMSMLWFPRGLKEHVTQSSVLAEGSSVHLVNSIVGVCEAKRARVLSLATGQTKWSTDGCFKQIALCQVTHHVAVADSVNVVVFPSRHCWGAPNMDTCGVAISIPGDVERIEWARVQSDTILAVFTKDKNASISIDLHCLVWEQGDAFGAGQDIPLFQMLHVCTVPFPRHSIPRLVPQSTTSCFDSLPSRLMIVSWEPDGCVRWCSYRFSQHSVPHRDLGGKVPTFDLLQHVFRRGVLEKLVSLEILTAFADRCSLVTSSCSWTTSSSVELVLRFESGLSAVLFLDHGTGTARIETLLCTGGSRAKETHVLLCEGKTVRCDEIEENVVEISVYHNAPSTPEGQAAWRLLHIGFADFGKHSCEGVLAIQHQPGLVTVAKGTATHTIDLNSLTSPATRCSASEASSSCKNDLLVVRLKPTLAASLQGCRSSKELLIPTSLSEEVSKWLSCQVVGSHCCRNSGFAVAYVIGSESLVVLRWDLLSPGRQCQPFIAHYHNVRCVALLPKSLNILICFANGDLKEHHWLTSTVTEAVDIPKLAVTGMAAVDSGMSPSIVLASDDAMERRMLARQPSEGLLSVVRFVRDSVNRREWRTVNAMLRHLIGTDGDAIVSVVRLIEERSGSAVWDVNAALPALGDLMTVHGWEGSFQSHKEPEKLDEDILLTASERLVNARIHASSSADQTELLCIVESLRSSAELLQSLRDAAACRFLFEAKVQEMRLSLRLPPGKMPWHTCVWASLSESQDMILQVATHRADQKLPWSVVESMKVPFWQRSLPSLRKMSDDIAREQYQSNREVRDCALMYLLAGKKATVVALCKACNDTRMQQFFMRDFKDEKNQAAAVSNAYVAIGKGNVWLGAAFFVLAGDGKSAAQIVLDRMHDLQLAMWIVRLCYDDDPSVIEWLRAIAETRSSLPCCAVFLFLWRSAHHIDAMRLLVSSGDDPTESTMYDRLQLIQFARSSVAVLSRRTDEYFPPAAELHFLARCAREAIARDTPLEKEEVHRRISEALDRNKMQRSNGAVASNTVGAASSKIGAADFAAGTVQLCADSDDDCGDWPESALPSSTHDTPKQEDAEEPTWIDDEESIEGFSGLLRDEQTCTQDRSTHILQWLIPDPAVADSNSDVCSEQVIEKLILMALNDVECSQLPTSIAVPAVLLKLSRWAVARCDVPLAIALHSVTAVWENTPIPGEGSSLKAVLEELLQSKIQAMERGHALGDAGSTTPRNAAASSEIDATQGGMLMQLFSLDIALSVLRRLSAKESRPTDAVATKWLPSLVYVAVGMIVNAETVLIVEACGHERDEPQFFAAKRRAAKRLVWRSRLQAMHGTESTSMHLHDLDAIVDGALYEFTTLHGKLPRTIVFPGGPIASRPWFSALRKRAKTRPLTDELMAFLMQGDEESLQWLAYVWSLRNHRFLESRRFLLMESIREESALRAHHLFFSGAHSISSMAVDMSTCDNVVVGTTSTATLLHGMREELAGDNNFILSRRAAERNATMDSLACWLGTMAPSHPVSKARPSLRAAAGANVASHPHLPFFLASQRDGHLDVFNFGDLDCVATSMPDAHNGSGSMSGWLAPVFSPNGYFVSLGHRGRGDVVSWKFEDLVSSAPHTTATLGKRVQAFGNSCTSLLHIGPYSSIVLVGGNEYPRPTANAPGRSQQQPPKNAVKVVDPAVTKGVLLSCELPHAVDFLVFDDAKRQALCVSEQGELSLYDARRNSIVWTCPFAGVDPGDDSKWKPQKTSITAVETIPHDDVLAMGLSNGVVMLLSNCIPQLCAAHISDAGQQRVMAAASTTVATATGSRPVAVTSLVGTPSALMFGLGDGRAGSIPLIPDEIKKSIVRSAC